VLDRQSVFNAIEIIVAGVDTIVMDRSQHQSAPTVFLVGCLFAFLVIAIELWPANMGRGMDRSIDGTEQWALAGDNIPNTNNDNRTFQQLPFVGSKKYGATIRADENVPVQIDATNRPQITALAQVPVAEPTAVISSPIPTLTSLPQEFAPQPSTAANELILGPPLSAPQITLAEPPPIEVKEELELLNEFQDAIPTVPLITKSSDIVPPKAVEAITPDPYSAKSHASNWPHVPALQRQFDEQSHPRAQAWSNQVKHQLTLLQREAEIYTQGSHTTLADLRQLVSTGKQIAKQIPTPAERSDLRRAVYALERRLALWTQVFRNADPRIVRQLEQYEQQLDPAAMLRILEAVDVELGHHPDNWQRFLSLAHIRDVASSNSFFTVETRANIAAKVLNRLSETEFSEKQQAIISKRSVQALRGELRKWVTAPLPLTELLANIEEYEIQPIDSRSQPVSTAWHRTRFSLYPTQQNLAQTINTHYRNSNVRLAVTEEFLNRLVPAIQDVQAPVREQILGADVRGLSETRMGFRVNLVPDKAQIRMRLEGDGVMSAATQSTKGGVTLMNRNRARFFVQKILLMDPRGVRMLQTESAASGSTNLTGLRTRFDTFPIVGSLVRRAAQKQVFETKERARMEFENRVASKARSQMDDRLQNQVMNARQRLDEKIIQPLERMQLNPTALAMETTEDRMTLRSRLASDYQLASFTARPQARADSLFSVQVHESALNNFATQLQLSGKEGDIRDVFLDIAKEMGVEDIKIPEEVPEGVKIRLAKEDPVRFEFRDGRIMISLRIEGLKYERRSWRNFEVHAYYRPTIDGFRCDLHRDEYIELVGHLKARHQIALRGIFTKVFSKGRPITLIHPEIGKDPRLAMLDVSQFVVRDGWVGVSVGPQGKTGQPLTARQSPATKMR
jgi:hypothetical protein